MLKVLLIILAGIALVLVGYISGRIDSTKKIVDQYLVGEFQTDNENGLNLLAFDISASDIEDREYVLLKVVKTDLSKKKHLLI